MVYRYFVNVGTLQAKDKTGWIGCWYIYDRTASDPLHPLLSGRSMHAWRDAKSSLVAAYEEALLHINALTAAARGQ
ncbi:hypothetical protein NRY95_07765 [Xanthomonas campestris pv. phormiicola]|nr:hypothetical protein [Xanthomonas campestris pv. phormiicola]UYC17838.1 hypothetical protein NRY95_07765 [Xanthomonas campestris pv. phormiicola]